MSGGTERERKMAETTQQANALVGLDPRAPLGCRVICYSPQLINICLKTEVAPTCFSAMSNKIK